MLVVLTIGDNHARVPVPACAALTARLSLPHVVNRWSYLRPSVQGFDDQDLRCTYVPALPAMTQHVIRRAKVGVMYPAA
jgi:hypothetical protein